MNQLFAYISFFLTTYIISSFIIFLAIAKLLRINQDNAVKYYLYSIGIGPIAISLMLRWIIYFFPKSSDFYYITFVIFIFGLIFLYASDQRYLIKVIFKKIHSVIIFPKGTYFFFEIVIWSVLAGVIILLFFQALLLPLQANDPLEYATGARLLYTAKDLSIFPFIDPSKTGGYYAVSSHPLGYMLLIVWGYMFQGGISAVYLPKTIAPMFALYTYVTVSALLYKDYGKIGSLFGALLMVAVPLYYSEACVCHIDSLRIYTFFLAFLWLTECITEKTVKFAIIAGIMTGFSMYCHSIGLLTLPIAAFVLLILLKEAPYLQRIKLLFFLVASALLIGGARYLSNYITMGSLISDSLLVMHLPHIEYSKYIEIYRGIGSFSDKILFGVLMGFSKISYFGLSYWFFLFSAILYFSEIYSNKKLFVSFLVISLFYFLVISSVIIGSNIFIKNSRYILTIQPFVSYIAPIIIIKFFNKCIC